MLDLEVEMGKPKVIKGMSTSKDANIVLGITGDVKGNMVLDLQVICP